MRFTSPLALVLAASLSTGCLTNAYKIPLDDLDRIAQTPPAERGKHVRVIQSLSTSEPPPRGPEVSTTTVIIVDPAPSYGASAGASSGGGARPGGGWGPSGKMATDDAKAWLFIGAIIAIASAGTEGARYDGWVDVHPMQRVHLYGPYGEYMQVPLAQLSPEHSRWAAAAYLRSDEGPWSPQGRAPLNRVGFTYNFYLGQSAITSYNGETEPGFGGRLQFGFFPIQQLGLLLDVGMYFRDNELNLDVYDGRTGFEVDFYPVTLGRLSLGGFAQIGFQRRIEDGGPTQGGGVSRDDEAVLFTGGGLVQLEITTRLALTGRAGWVRTFDENAYEFALGLSVY